MLRRIAVGQPSGEVLPCANPASVVAVPAARRSWEAVVDDSPVDAEAESVPSANHHRVVRAVALAVVAVGALAFAVEQRSLVGAGREVRAADREWLGVAVLAMIALLANQAMFHAAAQRATRLPTGPFGAVRPALAATFMNQVTKSGGMAGLTMLVADGDRRRLGRGPVVAAYALVAVLTELAFAGALAAALRRWPGSTVTSPGPRSLRASCSPCTWRRACPSSVSRQPHARGCSASTPCPAAWWRRSDGRESPSPIPVRPTSSTTRLP